MFRLSLFTLGLFMLCGPAWAQKVYVDYDKSADFGTYKTFAWKDSDEDLRDSDPLYHERVVRGIEKRLREGGMSQVADKPDLYVTYYTAEKKETVVYNSTLGYSWGADWYWGSGYGPSTSQAVTYTLGTLIIDIWDAKKSKLIWRGTATDTVSDNPKRVARQIEKALDKLVKRWEREYRKLKKSKS